MKQFVKQIIAISISLVLIVTGILLRRFLTVDETLNIILLIIFGLGFIIGGFYPFLEGIEKTIENKSLNVELLMIVAAIGAFFIGDYGEGAILIFIFGVAGILEEYAMLKSEKAFTDLLTLAPNKAIRISNNIEDEVDVKLLNIGDHITVKMGEQIPIDGFIVEGATSIDEKMITGEFNYKDKQVGDEVFAGTINMSSAIIVEVNKSAEETVVQKIIDFVNEAQENKTKSQTIIEKIEKWYVYFVILLALVVMFIFPLFGFWTKDEALLKGIIVLVVASPCALVASSVPAVLANLSRCSKEGVLVKGGKPFEYLRKIDVAVFDKTGTITEGKPQVEYYKTYRIDETEFLQALVSIERHSTHPLAKAITNYFTEVEVIPIQTVEQPGLGISGYINEDYYLIGRFDVSMCTSCKREMREAVEAGYSVVQVAKNNEMVGFIALKDTIREESRQIVETLNNQNIKTHLLTGDNYVPAKMMSEELGFTSFKSECLPDEKVEEIKLLKETNTVLMIGDGVNDAPALIESDVGIAMGSATDVSLEAADIVFINNKLMKIDYLIKRAKKMNWIILENIIFSVAIILTLLILNLFSNISITLGVIFHEGSTILVILNSLRLLFRKKT